MQNRSTIDVAKVITRGRYIYKSTWKAMLIFALLSIAFSNLVSIYIAIFDTFFNEKHLIYISGLVSLVLLYVPIIYFSIRINMTNARKLKALIKEQPFDYKVAFHESKDKFWRVIVVLIVRLILKVTAIIALLIPPFYIYDLSHPNYFGNPLGFGNLLSTMIICVITLIVSVYLLIRLEYSTLIIYWDLDVEGSDFKGSFNLTKHQLFKQLKIMFVARLPSLIISGFAIVYIISDANLMSDWIRWGYIFMTIGVETVIYTWMQSTYYPLFEQMKIFTLDKRIIDSEGREWLTF